MDTLLFPVGQFVGAEHRPADVVHRVRVGATFHELSAPQLAIWMLARGCIAMVGGPWCRESIEELSGSDDAAELIDELLQLRLLVEVGEPEEFARTHRVVPTMPGLGNSVDDPTLFSIGFFNQPMLQVTLPVYDIWQWSTMDDTLWATCENARHASGDDADLLTGFLGSLHALLCAGAAYVDVEFRLAPVPA